MNRWYALYTKPKKEQQICALLQQRDIEAYLPVLPVLKKTGVVETKEPLFPCYLFAHVDPDVVGLAGMGWLPGMRSVVNFCGDPAVVDDEVIDFIKRRLQVSSEPESHLRFKRGERVRITSGPFQNLEAIFDSKLSGSGRVRILLTIMGQVTSCETNEEFLKKAA
jgi:transcriptional antiterminator RfaH